MSTFPPAAPSALIASSLDTPNPINICIELSGKWLGGFELAGWVASLALGSEPRVCPVPGKPPPEGRWSGMRLSVVFVNGSEPGGTSGKRALSGNSCSERNWTSRPWIRSTPFWRSMHAWCVFSISKPKRRSTSRPCEVPGMRWQTNDSVTRCTYFHDCEGTRQIEIGQFELCTVDSAKNSGCSDSTCDTSKSFVNETHDSKKWIGLSRYKTNDRTYPQASAHSGLTVIWWLEQMTREGGLLTDCLLGTTIYERLDRIWIDFDRNTWITLTQSSVKKKDSKIQLTRASWPFQSFQERIQVHAPYSLTQPVAWYVPLFFVALRHQMDQDSNVRFPVGVAFLLLVDVLPSDGGVGQTAERSIVQPLLIPAVPTVQWISMNIPGEAWIETPAEVDSWDLDFLTVVIASFQHLVQ